MMARNYIWVDSEREEMLCALSHEQVVELFRDFYHYVSAGKTPDTFSTPEVKNAYEVMLKDDAEARKGAGLWQN